MDRGEIRAQHAAIHAGPYKHSALQVDFFDVRVLAPNVILALVRTELESNTRTPSEVRHSMVTFVIEQRAQRWGFAAAHNTLAHNLADREAISS
jgi:uncharacterized protein (TIGR02246 family)